MRRGRLGAPRHTALALQSGVCARALALASACAGVCQLRACAQEQAGAGAAARADARALNAARCQRRRSAAVRRGEAAGGVPATARHEGSGGGVRRRVR